MTTGPVLIVQHHDADTPGAIARVLTAHGIPMQHVRSHRGDDVPATPVGVRALVVMGGPMSANDDALHPFLAAEKRLIALAVEAAIPVIGVCLGAQLIASAVGGGVFRAPSLEVGWHEVTRDGADPLFDALPPRFTPFHWHGDAILLPPGATLLAHSTRTGVQAFRFRLAYGLQFHLESDASMVEAMVSAFPSDLRDAGVATSQLADDAAAHLAAQERLATVLFGRWAEMLSP